MTFKDDFERLSEIVDQDPSFRQISQDVIKGYLAEVQAQDTPEAFMLSAMALLALPGNGHTRLIPNRAIRILPLRLVAIGENYVLSDASDRYATAIGGALVSINGVPVDEIKRRAARYLAGTLARQRVIGGIIYVWPAALERLSIPTRTHVDFLFKRDSGHQTITLPAPETAPAEHFYPQNEHGQRSAQWMPTTFAKPVVWPDGLSIRLPNFFDPDHTRLGNAIATAVDAVTRHADQPLILDVRGNTGGDFLRTLPLIDALSETPRPCAVIVDKFTFSAAIVFVALLKHRLGKRLKVVGEDMGDGLRFFAEGGLTELPDCGAVVRHSSALHDWSSGTADATTPPDIAEQLVGVGAIDIDLPHPPGFKQASVEACYPSVFEWLTPSASS